MAFARSFRAPCQLVRRAIRHADLCPYTSIPPWSCSRSTSTRISTGTPGRDPLCNLQICLSFARPPAVTPKCPRVQVHSMVACPAWRPGQTRTPTATTKRGQQPPQASPRVRCFTRRLGLGAHLLRRLFLLSCAGNALLILSALHENRLKKVRIHPAHRVGCYPSRFSDPGPPGPSGDGLGGDRHWKF